MLTRVQRDCVVALGVARFVDFTSAEFAQVQDYVKSTYFRQRLGHQRCEPSYYG